jgi:hypothetical protein
MTICSVFIRNSEIDIKYLSMTLSKLVGWYLSFNLYKKVKQETEKEIRLGELQKIW